MATKLIQLHSVELPAFCSDPPSLEHCNWVWCTLTERVDSNLSSAPCQSSIPKSSIVETEMSNPRRTLHVNSSQNPDNPFQTQSNTFFSLNFLKKPHAFPFLLSIFLFLTWVSLRFQNSSHVSSRPLSLQRWNKEDDLKANLVRYLPFQLSKDTRGWLLNPVTAALNAGLSGKLLALFVMPLSWFGSLFSPLLLIGPILGWSSVICVGCCSHLVDLSSLS